MKQFLCEIPNTFNPEGKSYKKDKISATTHAIKIAIKYGRAILSSNYTGYCVSLVPPPFNTPHHIITVENGKAYAEEVKYEPWAMNDGSENVGDVYMLEINRLKI